MEKDFSTWLTTEMDRLGWTNSELARRASVVPSTISMVISKQKKPGPDLCNGVARALGTPPERVFREAGLLPSATIGQDSEENAKKQKLDDIWQYLTSEQRETVVTMAQVLYEKREAYNVDKRKK